MGFGCFEEKLGIIWNTGNNDGFEASLLKNINEFTVVDYSDGSGKLKEHGFESR
jgi:hypothetical protein